MLTVQSETATVAGRLLYGPGPSMVEASAYAAMSRPALGIRDPTFLQVISEVRHGLRHAFGTANRITFPVPASGSGAMETAVSNFVLPGTKVALFAAGFFADRIGIMVERHGGSLARLDKPWGTVFAASEAEQFIAEHNPDVVAFVQADTSTGAYQSGANIVPAAKKAGALVIADTVTSLGAMPVQLDEIGIDVAFSCSQKGLSCPAGLSPMSVSENAWSWLEKQTVSPSSWYLDLRLLAKYYEPPHAYHHTPSPPLFYAMQAALAAIADEGLKARWQRHRDAHIRLLTGLGRLGFTSFVEEPEARIWHLTTVAPPVGIDEAQLRQRLFDEHNIEIASGLGPLSGKILRIGTMGPLATTAAVDHLLSCISSCM